MSVNTSHTPDGTGVLIYNGEMILLFIKEVNLKFDTIPDAPFKGAKKGRLYLTSHRIMFTNKDLRDKMQSFCMPFHCLREVKLEQPIFGANYLKGTVLAQPGGNWEGNTVFNLSFNQGGCIDFGQALLKAVDLAARFRPMSAPPPYAPPPGGFFSPPPAYYMAADNYNGFVAPRQQFPDQPPASDVYMYESPPPYGGIGPPPSPYPAGATGSAPSYPPQNGTAAQEKEREALGQTSNGNATSASAPPPPSYDDAMRQ